MRVTVYLPPYLVGLKISDWTLAKAWVIESINHYVSSRTVLHAIEKVDAHLAGMEERKEVGAATRRSKDCQA